MSFEPNNSEIAIIGMSCVLPGAKDSSAFWDNILAKRCFIKDAPDSWCDGKYDANSKELDRIYTRRVGLLGDLAEFDPLEFGIVPNALFATEPDHFLALKLAARALRHAGYENKAFDRAATGIILGRGATPNRGSANGLMSSLALDQIMTMLHRVLPELDGDTLETVRVSLRNSLLPLVPEAAPGLVSNVAVGRIANRLDLQGPTYLIDAACASTLIAVELAMKELRSGQSRMMLAGGVQASMPPQVYMLFCQLNALSKTGAMPFDRKADGTILSEGCGFLVLKRRADAEADGDVIYAVLKAAGIASDGRAQGLLTPRVEGETLAIERAYAQCELGPESVGLIEAHGTGIPVGDKTEVEALSRIFPASSSGIPRVALGSVKSMIGHCIPAAGIASLVKTALALHYKILPPTLCDEVSEELPLADSALYVNTEVRPWIHANYQVPRRAGVNAFGFGGINAHIVLEEYVDEKAGEISGYTWPTELVVFSADSGGALADLVGETLTRLRARPESDLAELACELSRKEAKACRLAVVAVSCEDLLAKLEAVVPKIREAKRPRSQTRNGVYFDLDPQSRLSGRTVFMFPGQGSQYPHMLADLCMAFPSVRREFDLSDAAFSGIWSALPSQHVFPPPTGLTPAQAAELNAKFLSIDVAMETIFTANMALLGMLTEFGLDCDMMLGHSTGEYSALAASGAVEVPGSREEQIALKRGLNQFYREMNTAESVPRGALLTVGAVEPAVLAAETGAFGGSIYTAMDNCPHQQILFGNAQDIVTLAERLKSLGGLCQSMPFNYAYHTPLLGPMGAELMEFYRRLPIRTPHKKLISCASTGAFPEDPEEVRQLSVSQWSRTVRFRETIERLYNEEDVRFFVEVGPSAHLTAFVEDTLRKREFLAVASNERSRPGLEQLQRLLAQLWCRGKTVDFSPLYRHRAGPRFSQNPSEPGRPVSKFNKPLDVSMPVMQLNDEMVREIRSKSGLDRKNRPVQAAPSVRTSPPPAPADAVLVAHEQMMQEFLAAQQRGIEALLEQLNPQA